VRGNQLPDRIHHSAFFILPSAFTCGFHAISGLQDIGKLVDSVVYVAK
jgi:hypothetical protein